MTPSSQAKKSSFEVRTGMWVTVGKVLEAEHVTGKEEGATGKEEGKGKACAGRF